jgi:hypothetical protein
MLVVSVESLRQEFAEELQLLQEELPFMGDEFHRAHAKRTVLERIECQAAKMFDRMEAEREEMINKLWYG